MKVYTFEKNFQQRIDELSLILDMENPKAANIKDQWCDFLEETMYVKKF
jgi:hypothetical protein